MTDIHSRLTVTSEYRDSLGRVVCVCDCACGKTGVDVFKSNFAATGSCGCRRSELARERMSKIDRSISWPMVRELRSQGFSVRQIGRKIGLTGGRVQQIMAMISKGGVN